MQASVASDRQAIAGTKPSPATSNSGLSPRTWLSKKRSIASVSAFFRSMPKKIRPALSINCWCRAVLSAQALAHWRFL
jgi:hypothetical protein